MPCFVSRFEQIINNNTDNTRDDDVPHNDNKDDIPHILNDTYTLVRNEIVSHFQEFGARYDQIMNGD